jgi:hypothetical protein
MGRKRQALFIGRDSAFFEILVDQWLLASALLLGGA